MCPPCPQFSYNGVSRVALLNDAKGDFSYFEKSCLLLTIIRVDTACCTVLIANLLVFLSALR